MKEIIKALIKLHKNEADKLVLTSLLTNITVEKPTKSGTKTYDHQLVKLDKLVNHLNPLLAEHGLMITSQLDGTSLMTTLYHGDSGECIVSSVSLLKEGDSVQWMGARITQMRRNQIMGLLNIDDGTDTDGNVKGTQFFGEDHNEMTEMKGEDLVDGVASRMELSDEETKVLETIKKPGRSKK